MASVVTFAQLPHEEKAFLDYLQKTGEIWARAVDDNPRNPTWAPLPVTEFLGRFADQIVRYSVITVYLGFRDDILRPVVSVREDTEGGTLIPFVQHGEVVEGAYSIIGGTKILRDCIDPMASLFVRYDRGLYRTENELAASNLCFYSGSYEGQTWVTKSEAFLKWANKVLNWMRRHTPETVPVYQCNYEIRATVEAAEASKNGLNVR
jgi:hypothetical protein